MRDIAEYALEQLMRAGADKAAASATRGTNKELNVENDKFSLLRTVFSTGLGLVAFVGQRKGAISINRHDRASIDEACQKCVALARAGEPDSAWDIAPKQQTAHFDRTIGGADMDKLFSRTQEYLQLTHERYPKIRLESVIANFADGIGAYVNSNGTCFTSNSENYGFVTVFAAVEGESTSSVNYTGAAMKNLDTSFLELVGHERQLADSEESLKAAPLFGKFVGPVIFAPSAPDVWHTIIGCFLADAPMIEGISPWKDRLNTQVAHPSLTMRSIPLDSRIVLGERFTGDGFLSEDMDLIAGGVLKNFALSLYGANKLNLARARNTAAYTLEITPGTSSLESLIGGIARGILVNRFSGAQPSPNGDISGVAKNSFLIENGRISHPIQETMLSFNAADALQNIAGISQDTICDGGCVLPWAVFDGVTVSGK